MPDAIAPSLLTPWESFYVIVGSSAAALTGLQFVVIALVAESRRKSSEGTINAFATPTIVHFCAALLVSAILSAPFEGLAGPAYLLAAGGAAGAGYALVVARRAGHQTGYQPVLEDWLWHTAFPFLAYTLQFGAALELLRHPTPALFAIATVSLVLLFIGIHNAWDTVTYVVVTSQGPAAEYETRPEPPPPPKQ